MIPLLHDFEGETVLVFGGGAVGARKARRFGREAHAVIVVSPEFRRPADEFGDAEFVRAAPAPGDVSGWLDSVQPALVVAATDDADLNEAVERTARDRGTLVNRADEAGGRAPGSVVVPATVRDDPVVVAVATGGASPALSRYIREHIEGELVDGHLAQAGAMAELTASLRAGLKDRGVPSGERREAIRAVVESRRVWKALGQGDSNPRRVAETVVSNSLGENG